jgi:hypothetical protein
MVTVTCSLGDRNIYIGYLYSQQNAYSVTFYFLLLKYHSLSLDKLVRPSPTSRLKAQLKLLVLLTNIECVNIYQILTLRQHIQKLIPIFWV